MAAPPKVVVAAIEKPVDLAPETIKAIQPQKRQARKQSESTAALDDEISLKTKGQRRVNLIWEYTQSYVAILVVTSTVVVAVLQAYRTPQDFPDILTLLAGVVVGNYFARTNHAAIGGVGSKPSSGQYEGR